MTVPRTISFLRREDGASLIEYTLVISLFLLIFFALLDFGRLGFNWVMTEKAMQRAVRIAVTRPPVCPGVPETHRRGADTTPVHGEMCRDGAGVCADEGVQQCVLGSGPIDCAAPTGETRQEIWCLLQPVLPSNAQPPNIRLSYSYDPNLGFLGGPYTPIVEVGVVTRADVAAGLSNAQELRFSFVTPLPGFAALAAGAVPTNIVDTGSDGLADIPFPDLSVSMPGEDMNQGNRG
jgi:hypothetical protein